MTGLHHLKSRRFLREARVEIRPRGGRPLFRRSRCRTRLHAGRPAERRRVGRTPRRRESGREPGSQQEDPCASLVRFPWGSEVGVAPPADLDDIPRAIIANDPVSGPIHIARGRITLPPATRAMPRVTQAADCTCGILYNVADIIFGPTASAHCTQGMAPERSRSCATCSRAVEQAHAGASKAADKPGPLGQPDQSRDPSPADRSPRPPFRRLRAQSLLSCTVHHSHAAPHRLTTREVRTDQRT